MGLEFRKTLSTVSVCKRVSVWVAQHVQGVVCVVTRVAFVELLCTRLERFPSAIL